MAEDPVIVPGPYRADAGVVVSSTGRLMADSLHIQGFFPELGGQMDPVGFRPGNATDMIRGVRVWLKAFRRRSDVAIWVERAALGVEAALTRLEKLLAEGKDMDALAIAAAKLGVMLQSMAARPMTMPAHNDRIRMQRLRSGYNRRYGDVPAKRQKARTMYRQLRKERPDAKEAELHEVEASGNEDLYDKFVAVAIAEAIEANAAWYCWHASRRQKMLEEVWTKHGAFAHQQIIWAKDRPILTRSWYMWQHEPCLMGWVRPNKPPRIADDFPHSVWNIPTVPVGERTDHPTSKPVEVFAIPMRQHTKVGDICYEPFSGSGSQLIAAQMLSRRCYGLEISPVYCDVVVARWEAHTGKKAKRVKHAVHVDVPTPEKASTELAEAVDARVK